MQHSHFVHLHVHTQFSLLDGACKIPELIALAKEYKMPAVAITDHGNMFGAIEFYSEAMKNGIKPIIGCEVYVAPGSRFDRTTPVNEEASYHLILLAKDEEGYRNLMKLVSAGYLEGFYYKPRVDKELLTRYSRGLIAQSACLQGEIPYLIVKGKYEEAKLVAARYKEIFGNGDFYLELQKNLIPEQEIANAGLLKLAKELEIRLVATGDVHYMRKKSARAHEGLLCIQTQSSLNDPDHMKFSTDEFYFKSSEDFKEMFEDVPQAINSTIEIAEKCNLELEFNKTHLPQFTPPEGKAREEYLRELVEAGLKKRYPAVDKVIEERVEHELNIIKKTGFTSYFLIAWDFINYAKSKSIPVGPGRGSAAGSVVSYVLGITDLDPIRYDLIFERFLNPDRVSLPDIDIDFCYERRQEVIDYVTGKYSKENVAQVITFGTMQARAVIRDVGRVMGISYGDVDRIAKLVPQELDITLERALKLEPELRNLYKSDPQIRQLIDVSTELEGLTRHASTHAAGVVISDRPLTDYIPLFKTGDGLISTGYEMKSLEKIGLLKMDFLGLRTLTVIEEALKIIKRTKGVAIDFNNMPLDDQRTYELLSNAESLGIFQLESSGMRDILRKLKPTNFEDIIAILALYRPGPIGTGMVEDFIKRKHGLAPIKYDHKLLEPILKETYGTIVYQEQVMRIASDLAGFTMSQADSLRRAMGKKIPEEMEQAKSKFLDGAVKKGIDRRTSEKIFNFIEYFAGYGFNKCVVGSTEILDADTGKKISVKELFENKDKISHTFGCSEDLKIIKTRIKDVIYNGVKPVYVLRTVLGKEIVATSNHPVLTCNGWKNISDIKTGERIAAAGRIPQQAEPLFAQPHEIISLAWGRNDQVAGLKDYYGRVAFNKESKDTLPPEIRDIVKDEKCKAGLTWRQLEARSGVSIKEFCGRLKTYKKGFRRDTILRIGSFLESPRLLRYATSDLTWDSVKSVEFAGYEPTFDLEIENVHNFVANGLIVHNSHSTAYALISYRTAYLKANYPVEFMTALMTSERDNIDKVAFYIEESERMGIQILPPSINESFSKFTVAGNAIRFGLSAVKNAGHGAIDSIITARNTGGNFKNLYDFCERVDLRLTNRKVLESLIKCGAFDEFGLYRSQLMALVDDCLECGANSHKERLSGQSTFFEEFGAHTKGRHSRHHEIPKIPEWHESQLLAFEKEMLGFYITGHPLAKYEKLIRAYSTCQVKDLGKRRMDEEVNIGGIISKLKFTITKAKSEKMAIMSIEDLTGEAEVLVFPRAFVNTEKFIRKDAIVCIKGKVNLREDRPKIIASDIMPLEELQRKYTQALIISLNTGIDEQALTKLKTVLESHPGTAPVYLHFKMSDGKRFEISVEEKLKVEPSDSLTLEIEGLLGEGVVSFKT